MPPARPGWHILLKHTPSQTGIYALIRKLTNLGQEDYRTTSGTWDASPAGGIEQLPLSETSSGSGSYYRKETDLDGYTGMASLEIFDSGNVCLLATSRWINEGYESPDFEISLEVPSPKFLTGSTEEIIAYIEWPSEVTLVTNGALGALPSGYINAVDDQTDYVPLVHQDNTVIITPVGDEAWIDIELLVDHEISLSKKKRIYAEAWPGTSSGSVVQVSEGRTFQYNRNSNEAVNYIKLDDVDEATIAFNFANRLNPGTIISAITTVVEDGTAHSVTIATPAMSVDKKSVHCKISDLTASTVPRFRATIQATDGETLSGFGQVEVT